MDNNQLPQPQQPSQPRQVSSQPIQSPQPAPQPIQPQSPQPLFAPDTNPFFKPPKKSHKKLFLIIGIIVVLLLAGIAAFVVLKKPFNKNQAPQVSNTQNSNINVGSIGETYDSLFKAGITEFEPAKKQATLETLQKLTNGFALDNDFFADGTNALVALGIARLAVDDTNNASGYRNEMYLAAVEYLSSVPEGIDDKYSTATESDENTVKVFEKYTDKDLTQKLQTALKNDGLEAEIKQNLKLSGSQSLQPYTALVMDFSNFTPRQEEFAKEHYMFGAQPKMWVEKIGTTTYILFTKKYAEDFLANPNASVRSSVIHEFVHAQNAFVVGDLGRNVEERRAELFSGDKSAYYDTKQLFVYSEVFSGINTVGLLEQYPTDKQNFYVNLYKQFGLNTANNIMASWPNAYLDLPSGAVAQVAAMSGNLNGVIEDTIAVGDKNQTAMNTRMKERADKLFVVLKTKEKVIEDINENLGKAYEMPAAAQKMNAFIEQNY